MFNLLIDGDGVISELFDLMTMSASGRESVTLPIDEMDAIMIDPDNSPPTQPLPRVVIGEPTEGYNIHQSMIITHNYFEKVLVGDGPGNIRAKCLICLQEKKKELLLKMSDGNLKGKQIDLVIIFYILLIRC